MAEVGPEACAQLLECLLLVTEVGEARRVAVLLEVVLVEGRVLVAGPVEDGEVGIRRRGGRGSQRQQRDAAQQAAQQSRGHEALPWCLGSCWNAAVGERKSGV